MTFTNLGSLLKQARSNKNITQKELTNVLGVSTVYYSNIENNRKYPNPEVLLKISTALDLDYELLSCINIFSKSNLIGSIKLSEESIWFVLSFLNGQRKRENGETIEVYKNSFSKEKL